jgi:TonB family protein
MQRLRIVAITVLFGCLVIARPNAAQQPASEQSQSEPTGPASQTTVDPATSQESPRLVVTKFKRPVYPEQAQRQQLQGRVWVHLVIDEKGNVVSAEPVSGDPILLVAAVSAMKDWKFEPFMQNGQAVRVSTKMHYDFAFTGKVYDKEGKTGGSSATELNPTAESVDQKNAQGSATPDSTKKPLSIAQGVSQGLLIHQVRPVYPRAALQHYEQGTVVLQAIIGKDGVIKDLHIISSPSDDLAKAAMGAVEQWRYRPYVLNGEPVEVDTTINVNFKLH